MKVASAARIAFIGTFGYLSVRQAVTSFKERQVEERTSDVVVFTSMAALACVAIAAVINSEKN